MIAKVLWQAWLNWCVSKFIYTTSMEQHLWYVLWNWKRSLLESQPCKRCSSMLDTNPKSLDSVVWASPASHPTCLTKPPCILYLFMSAAGTGDSRRPGWKALRCMDSPLCSSEGCPLGRLSLESEKRQQPLELVLDGFQSTSISGCSPGCLGMQKHQHCFTSSVFTNIKHLL